MKKETLSTLVYSVAGIAMGYVSYLVKNNYSALLLAVIFLFLISEILKRALKIKEEFKWFWSNGGWIYLFLWFITWVVFYNL
jgi:hypothetical protein